MRLVGDDQMIVLKQNDFVKRNTRLFIYGAIVVNAHVAGVRALGRNRQAKFIHHEVMSHSL